MLNKILKQVNKPYQYIGNELNISKKDFNDSKVKTVLVFPDVYEIGASNFGLKLLYELINRNENIFCDRAYAPNTDFILELQKYNSFLYGIESKKPLKDFDFVGFSLQYELFYPTILKILELGGIEIFNDKRNSNSPIIIAGGPCAYNPEPMSKFIDLFMIGDGEDVNIEVFNLYSKLKEENKTRDEIIEALSKIEGVYSPKYTDKSKRVNKRVSELRNDNAPINLMVPNSKSIHDRAIVEIRRGCGRMCRFCQAGHTNLPIREREVDDVRYLVGECIKNTGYDEVSLLSLSSNDYQNIEPVLEKLNEILEKRHISISLPSQRIDKFSVDIAKNINKVRKTTITLAPEAGSERLRRVINKNLTKEQIVDTVLKCYKENFDSFKFYFMIGLPTETYEDLDEMANLLKFIIDEAKKIRSEYNIKNPLKITISLSIFVPKPFTPFQYAPQDNFNTIDEKISYLKNLISKIKGVKLNYHSKKVSQLEACFSRGDSSLCELVYKMYKNGQYLISWEENIDFELINELSGFKLSELATKKYSLNEKLPWDFISCGINENWFKEQYKLAVGLEQNIKPCESGCINCGVCSNLNVRKKLAKKVEYIKPQKEHQTDELNKTSKTIRVKYKKLGDLKYLSHLDMQNVIIKILNRCGFDLDYTNGFNPTPKISFSQALGLFMESDCEFFDFCIFDDIKESDIKNLLSENTSQNLVIDGVKIYNEKPKTLDKTIEWAQYEVELLSNENKINILNTIKERILDENFEIKKENKKKKTIQNIKVVKSLKEAKIVNDKLYITLKTGTSQSDIPNIRCDVLIEKANLENYSFKIKRTKFYDENLKEVLI
ncbi:MAG: hypothetical protein BHW64_02130 [Candidatus Melainabacteria bacterium LEY3_CP_29_8]|nr:MAG: hypothetical protein BHW64_02130 [Candidatus Melainabacteria bacterium LEY3_CP_29_8]